ncbi:MAG TPA: CehA/McbA family metallohydrolase [Candidatus Dormibacteraeota bacterium]|nr:CehA/McbA family metallohydrolase [Candidatus Dormibacteraeota bacterium]
MAGRGLADLHLHTSFSDGWPSPEEVVDHVTAATNLDVIAVTDHDTIEGALRAAEYSARTAGVPVIVGEEVSSRQGHILGLFLERRVRPGLSAAETVDEIHRQGGIAIAAHPFWRTERMAERFRGAVHGLGWLAAELDFDAVEVENSTPGLGLANLLARRLAEGSGQAAVGGSDAHIIHAIGKSTTGFQGRSPGALRSAIERGATIPVRSRYEVGALLHYLAWGFNHDRVATVLEQVPG